MHAKGTNKEYILAFANGYLIFAGGRMKQIRAVIRQKDRRLPKNVRSTVPMDSCGYCDILFSGTRNFGWKGAGRSMTDSTDKTIQVTCPCCSSTLFVDVQAGTIKEWKEAKDPRKSADLRDAHKLLADEKARVEARYQEIVKSDKEKGATMDKKFREFMEKSKGEPDEKPLRDVDLD